MILSLGRSGSLPIYANNLAKNFCNIDFDIYISKQRVYEITLNSFKEFTTYSNKWGFLINTLFYLPVKIISLLPKIYKDYNALYLPYKHFWDLPFIFIFRVFGKKVYFTVHDGVLHKGERDLLSQGMNNFRIKKSNEIIFLTEYVKENVFSYLKLNKTSYILPHPIIENDFVTFSEKTKGTRNILFLGRIDKYKGIELLMESAVEIDDSFDELIIAGKSQYKIDYIKHSKITILDKYLSEKEMGELLTWADVLVLPYTEATQSGVITLGIYAELPMICTEVGGFSEQLEKNESFWCQPNKESLIKAIKTVFSSPKEVDEVKQRLMLKKKENSWKEISKKIEKVLLN